jgi:hypothetical protein
MLGRPKYEYFCSFVALYLTGTLVALVLVVPAGAEAATAEAGPLTPALAELGTPTVAVDSATAQAEALDLPSEGPGSIAREGERLIVEAHFEEGAVAAVEALEAAGGEILLASAQYQTVALSVEPEDLEALAEVPGLTVVTPIRRPVYYGVGEGANTAVTSTNCEGGSVISQGVAQLNVPAARTAFGVHGAGETVGVISDSFNTATAPPTKAATDEASNDLPGPGSGCVGQQVPVRVLEEDPKAGTDEGRAMLQVVHDVAPEAQLAFATAEGGELILAHNIERLAAPVAAGGAGASVIVDDVSYYSEPFYQDGPVATAIQKVTSAGVAYFTSAGNDNLIEVKTHNEIGSWEAPAYRPTACPAVVKALPKAPPDCMDFNPGGAVDNEFRITVEAGETVVVDLQWAEPWFGVGTDLNAYLLSAGKIVAKETVENRAGSVEMPVEVVGWENKAPGSREVQLVIARCSGACDPAASATAVPRLKFELAQDGGGVSSIEYPLSEGGDIVGPTIYGHAGSGAAITLGAVRYSESATAPKEPEFYSSRGPVTHYFGPVTSVTPAAALAAPEELRKPNLTATDCASTTFFAQFEGGSYHFCGTSEAAPHAAAVAALMRQMNPVAPVGSIVAAMEASTIKYTSVTSPQAVGAGMLNAAAAMGVLGPPPPVPTPPTPVVKITKGPKAATNQKRPTFEFTSSVAATFACQFNGAAVQICASPYVAPTALADGAHSFTVTATAQGVTGSSGPWAFKVDTKAPKTKIVGHPKKVIKTRKHKVVARFKLKSNEKPVTFYCKVDRKKQRVCGKNFRYRFGRGKHVLKVKAKDAAGNIAAKPTVFSFRVRVLPPKRSGR